MHSSLTAPGTWVYFFTDANRDVLVNEYAASESSRDFYQILDVRRVTGQSRVQVPSGQWMLRVESPAALPAGSSAALFKGTVRQLHYTGASARSELQKKSAAIYPSSETTLAVLIPIRKSTTWWALSQEERQIHFEKRAGLKNHFSMGSDYAAKIYRKLYHSRYLETVPALDYDFLTYFEFNRQDKSVFMDLLRELRDTEANPEWAFVEYELEIWMSKNSI